MKDITKLVWDEYGIKRKIITTKNPQENTIVEQAHQTIGNLFMFI
jgi:hypothetical protein